MTASGFVLEVLAIIVGIQISDAIHRVLERRAAARHLKGRNGHA